MDILTVLIISVHECRISFHLFVFSLISFIVLSMRIFEEILNKFIIVVLGGSTLWHLQKFLHQTSEFTPPSFSACSSFTSLIKLVPRYFIFVVIVDGIVF
jgi:hypothetical protein